MLEYAAGSWFADRMKMFRDRLDKRKN